MTIPLFSSISIEEKERKLIENVLNLFKLIKKDSNEQVVPINLTFIADMDRMRSGFMFSFYCNYELLFTHKKNNKEN